MFDEFIRDLLEQNEKETISLQEQLEELNREEKDKQQQISLLFDTQDVGLEIFSPRTSGSPMKDKVASLQKEIEEIQFRQMQISEKIGLNQEKTANYQKMLEEARRSRDDNYGGASSNSGKKASPADSSVECDRLKEILFRVERCLNLVGHDRNGCKEELRNLRYYLKAQISSFQ